MRIDGGNWKEPWRISYLPFPIVGKDCVLERGSDIFTSGSSRQTVMVTASILIFVALASGGLRPLISYFRTDK